ncbi:hypothetical protein [Verrucosispora sp. WMMD573]|uniref:hypothetical protein n=1 Tax=Verrucosispora sp. WMMD573 TaxID=3015149 RepID=UPI00248B5478|nr:hypothetical protein [Verrucosispora sp. WMMD573]WBB56882.1 hypothetical protein O7601_12885 [Verrucosispora sp. WMMD573]
MTRLFRRKTAAVAIAALALALAGGGIAVAKPTAESAQPTARSAQQPAVTTASLNSAKATLAKGDGMSAQAVSGFYATAVNANGTKARGAGVVIKYGVGEYEVQFGSNVTNGIYVATIGRPDSCCVPPAGEISVARRLLTPSAVFIQTRDSAGVPADLPFYLLVHR